MLPAIAGFATGTAAKIFSTAGEPSNRKQWNTKIDHIFNQSHKISGAWSFEKDYASDAFMTWPNTWEGKDYNQPQVLTVNFVRHCHPGWSTKRGSV